MNNGNSFNFCSNLKELAARMQIHATMVSPEGYHLLNTVVRSAMFSLPAEEVHTQLLSTPHTRAFQLSVTDVQQEVRTCYVFGKVPNWMVAELEHTTTAYPYVQSLIDYLSQSEFDGRAYRSLRTFLGFASRLENLQNLTIAHNGGKSLILDASGLIPTKFYLYSNDPTAPELAVYVEFSYVNNRAAEPQEVE